MMLPRPLHSSKEIHKTRNEVMKVFKTSGDSIARRQRYSFGRLISFLCILLAGWLFLLYGTPFEGPSRHYQLEYVPVTPFREPVLDTPQSNHRTEVVQWDQHSLIIYGQRVMLWCVPECLLSQALVTLELGPERYIHGGCPFLLSGGTFWRRLKLLE